MFNFWSCIGSCRNSLTLKRLQGPLCMDPKVDLMYVDAQALLMTSKYNHWVFETFAHNTEYFRNVRNLEIQSFDWVAEGILKCGRRIHRRGGGFLNIFHGLKELHTLHENHGDSITLGDNSTQIEQCLQILYQWYQDNTAEHPPQALHSIPE